MQLSFSFDLINMIDVDDEVFMVHNIVEEMNLSFLNSAYQNIGRKPSNDCKSMLKILIFAYLNRLYSSRDIEKACKYDVRFKWILSNSKPPSYVTINRFRNKIYPFLDKILIEFVNLLIDYGEIDLKSIYVDGTKIESNANKYTFVWKKSILKYQERLVGKINDHFKIDKKLDAKECIKFLKNKFNKVRNTCKKENLTFVYGQGRRKSQLQKEYELYEEWINRLTTYEKHLEIMGERNSYSRTDHDATFMRMKEDHMRNGQLKPAYNIQCATNGGYVVGIESFPKPSDVNTLIPFLEKINNSYDRKINRLVADSGYESEENYMFLKENNIESFIKPQNYEQKKKRKYKNDISKKENMKYLEDEDSYVCAKGRKLDYVYTATRKNSNGYRSEYKVYESCSCNGCELSEACMKYKNKDNLKKLYVSSNFEKLRNESELNINSIEGKEELVNRSIQAEGVFSYIKSGMKYNRFNHRGKSNIVSELKILSLAINIRKLSSKLKKNRDEFTRYKIVIQ